MGFWNSIGRGFKSMGNGIKKVAGKAWNGIKAAGGAVANAGSKAFNTIGGLVRKGTDAVYNVPVIGGVTKFLTGGIRDNVVNGLESTGNMLGNLRDGKYKQALQNGASALGSVVSVAGGPVMNKVINPSTLNAITNASNGINMASNLSKGNIGGAFNNAQGLNNDNNKRNIYRLLKGS